MLCLDLVYETLLGYSHGPTLNNFISRRSFHDRWYSLHKWDDLENMLTKVIESQVISSRAILPELIVTSSEYQNCYLTSDDPQWTRIWEDFRDDLRVIKPDWKILFRDNQILVHHVSSIDTITGPSVLCLVGLRSGNELVFGLDESIG